MLCESQDLALEFQVYGSIVTASGVLNRPTRSRSRSRHLARSRSRSIWKKITPGAFFYFEVLYLSLQGKFVDVSYYLIFFNCDNKR